MLDPNRWPGWAILSVLALLIVIAGAIEYAS